VSGADFLAKYGSHGDSVTTVAPDASYAVRTSAAHPVHEHARVSAFGQLLRAPPSDDVLAVLGELMRQSHESYSACGLGSAATDALCALVDELGPLRGLYGAKITGGGSGGTVCVLGRVGCDDAIREVAARYAEKTGKSPYIFKGSSQGAAAWGILRVLVH
jgi:L-arabinokinase